MRRPTKSAQRGGRPPKIQDHLVHRIVELIQMADGILENEKVQNAMARGGIRLIMADGTHVDIDRLDEIALGVGRFICGGLGGVHLQPKYRPQLLRQIADALEGKSARKRKSGKSDDIAKIQAAWRKAKAALTGLYRGENPTFAEVDEIYLRDNPGQHLDRRALKQAGCPVRPDRRGPKTGSQYK